jgi:hypothetical protein
VRKETAMTIEVTYRDGSTAVLFAAEHHEAPEVVWDEARRARLGIREVRVR